MLVFISHNISDSPHVNLGYVKSIYRKLIVHDGVTPIAPYVITMEVLNDREPTERQMGMDVNFEQLKKCDELWVYGTALSSGVKEEMRRAYVWGIPILCKSHVRRVQKQFQDFMDQLKQERKDAKIRDY